jgi:uncharacterized protein (DUF58 family)
MAVVLDTSAASYDLDTFEEAVRITASLAVAAMNHDFPLQLRTTGGAVASVERGCRHTDLLDLLAGVTPRPEDPGLASLPGMVPAEEGVSLGVVTGRPSMPLLEMVSRVRPRYQMVSLVLVGGDALAPNFVPGALTVSVPTAAGFAAAWNKLVRR